MPAGEQLLQLTAGTKCLPGQSVPRRLEPGLFWRRAGPCTGCARFRPRGIGCRGWGVGGAFSGTPQTQNARDQNQPPYLNQKGNNPNVKYTYYSDFSPLFQSNMALYQSKRQVKPAEAARGLAHPGPQPALLRGATPGAALEPHLELAGHGHHLMVRRVVLVAVREHQSDIGTKFLSITVLTGLQFRLKRQDGSWLVMATPAPRRAVCRSKSTSQWLGV